MHVPSITLYISAHGEQSIINELPEYPEDFKVKLLSICGKIGNPGKMNTNRLDENVLRDVIKFQELKRDKDISQEDIFKLMQLELVSIYAKNRYNMSPKMNIPKFDRRFYFEPNDDETSQFACHYGLHIIDLSNFEWSNDFPNVAPIKMHESDDAKSQRKIERYNSSKLMLDSNHNIRVNKSPGSSELTYKCSKWPNWSSIKTNPNIVYDRILYELTKLGDPVAIEYWANINSPVDPLIIDLPEYGSTGYTELIEESDSSDDDDDGHTMSLRSSGKVEDETEQDIIPGSIKLSQLIYVFRTLGFKNIYIIDPSCRSLDDKSLYQRTGLGFDPAKRLAILDKKERRSGGFKSKRILKKYKYKTKRLSKRKNNYKTKHFRLNLNKTQKNVKKSIRLY